MSIDEARNLIGESKDKELSKLKARLKVEIPSSFIVKELEEAVSYYTFVRE